MLIGEAVLRTNPGYELVLLDRLEPAERQLASEEADGHDIPYGLLRPVGGSGLQPRIVSTDTALLALTLTVPGPCPAYVRARSGERLATSLGRLVLDGILEVEVDGTFRSGVSGWAPFAPVVAGDGRGGRTAELSIDAVRYGQSLLSLAHPPADVIATRLYLYGRRPVTPRLLHRMQRDGPLGDGSTRLGRSWVETRQASTDSPWRSWQPRRMPRRAGPGSSYKLYVSPTVETLPDAFAAVGQGLTDAPGVLGFKVGRTADGIARPDKMVAYFATLAQLHEGAGRIRERATACLPHGVPFTAAVTDDGLLSWAIDPPRGALAPDRRMSWRTWLTTRLADYLLDAGAEHAPPARAQEPWQVALARLRLDGVDTVSWVPDQAIFDADGVPR
jgi:hypothetical protein